MESWLRGFPELVPLSEIVDQLRGPLGTVRGNRRPARLTAQLPDNRLGAGRDLAGVRKVVLDAVQQAQGKGCAPGILGVSNGGDRGSSYIKSKEVLFSKMGTRNEDPKLAELERQYDQLNQVVIEQGRLLARLEKENSKMSKALQTMELEKIRANNPKPPHYQ